eukprot:8590156-Pyramimonas_sp.AAC.1
MCIRDRSSSATANIRSSGPEMSMSARSCVFCCAVAADGLGGGGAAAPPPTLEAAARRCRCRLGRVCVLLCRRRG